MNENKGLMSTKRLSTGLAFMQAIALIKTRIIPRWQSILFLVGVLLMGVPDGVEIVNLTASVLLTVAFIPYGIRLIRDR